MANRDWTFLAPVPMTHSQAMRNVSPPLSKPRPVTLRTILSALVAIGFAAITFAKVIAS
jgi:hypothetical protein